MTKYKKEYEIKNRFYEQIKTLIFNEMVIEAKKELEKFLMLYPNDVYARLDFAKCLLKLGNTEEALDILLEMKENNSKVQKFVYKNLIIHYIRIKDYKKLKNMIDEAVQKKIIAYDEKEYYMSSYYYLTDGIDYGNKVLRNIKTNNPKLQAKIFLKILSHESIIYYINNQKEIETKLLEIIKNYFSYKQKAFYMMCRLKYYCNEYDSSYNYLKKSENKDFLSIDMLIIGYDLCIKLRKNDEVQIYKDLLNKEYERIKDIEYMYKEKSKIEEFNGNYEQALNTCEMYIDDSIITAYNCSKWCVLLGKYERAKTILSNVIEDYYDGNIYVYCIQSLIGILIYEKKYEEAYQIFNKKREVLIDANRLAFNDGLLIHLSKKMNFLYDSIHKDMYINQQLQEYDLNKAIDKVQSQLDNGLIKSNITAIELIEYVKTRINNNRIFCFNTTVKYIVTYYDINKEKKLLVSVIPSTNDIIDITPYSEIYMADMDDELASNEKGKQMVYKRESQIEKFMKKYNMS